MNLTLAAVAVLPGAAATPACAQGQVRTIAVSATADWKHDASKLVLPPNLGGLARNSVRDTTDSEADVSASYTTSDQSTVATLYIYRPAVTDVAVWFDRAQEAIEGVPQYGIGSTSGATAAAFAPPGSATASALRVTYSLPAGKKLKATALAMVPVGDWMVKVRLSSSSLDAAGLNQQLDAVISGIVWPKSIAGAPAAALVKPCDRQLEFEQAKELKPEGAQVLLMAAMLGNPAVDDPADAASKAVYCRDREEGLSWAMYRKEGGLEAYMLALGDAGRAVNVVVGLELEPSKPAGYAVNFIDVDKAYYLVSFDKMPSPEQALAAANKGEILATASRGGKDISLSMEKLK